MIEAKGGKHITQRNEDSQLATHHSNKKTVQSLTPQRDQNHPKDVNIL